MRLVEHQTSKERAEAARLLSASQAARLLQSAELGERLIGLSRVAAAVHMTQAAQLAARMEARR